MFASVAGPERSHELHVKKKKSFTFLYVWPTGRQFSTVRSIDYVSAYVVVAAPTLCVGIAYALQMWPLRRQALKHARSVRRLVNSRLRQHHASLCCRLFATGQGGGSSAHENAGSTAKRSGKYHLGDSNHDKGVLKMRKWDRRQIRNERERRLQVALVGRPNVGKSTLYNRLTREKDAIIHDSPGTTRDWRIGQGVLGDLDFSVIDTGGLEEGPPSSMRGQIVAQCERAVHEAHLVLFMMDARAGVVDMDFQFANWLRRLSGSTEFKTQLVLNKTEVRR